MDQDLTTFLCHLMNVSRRFTPSAGFPCWRGNGFLLRTMPKKNQCLVFFWYTLLSNGSAESRSCSSLKKRLQGKSYVLSCSLFNVLMVLNPYFTSLAVFFLSVCFAFCKIRPRRLISCNFTFLQSEALFSMSSHSRYDKATSEGEIK